MITLAKGVGPVCQKDQRQNVTSSEYKRFRTNPPKIIPQLFHPPTLIPLSIRPFTLSTLFPPSSYSLDRPLNFKTRCTLRIIDIYPYHFPERDYPGPYRRFLKGNERTIFISWKKKSTDYAIHLDINAPEFHECHNQLFIFLVCSMSLKRIIFHPFLTHWVILSWIFFSCILRHWILLGVSRLKDSRHSEFINTAWPFFAVWYTLPIFLLKGQANFATLSSKHVSFLFPFSEEPAQRHCFFVASRQHMHRVSEKESSSTGITFRIEMHVLQVSFVLRPGRHIGKVPVALKIHILWFAALTFPRRCELSWNLVCIVFFLSRSKPRPTSSGVFGFVPSSKHRSIPKRVC